MQLHNAYYLPFNTILILRDFSQNGQFTSCNGEPVVKEVSRVQRGYLERSIYVCTVGKEIQSLII